MKYFLFLLSFILISLCTYAQSVVCPHTPRLVVYTSAGDTIPNFGYDTLNCGTTCVTMHATIDSNDLPGTTTYAVSSVAYSPFPYTGTLATYSGVPWSGTTDDEFGDLVGLPFSFCYFGTSYTSIAIGTNGNITFNAGLANSYDPYSITGPMPGVNCNATKNCIMSPWNDTYVGGGNIYYAVYGTAPCREFVISYDSVDLFLPGSFCDGNRTKSQIVLYESSNTIDIYIGKRNPCSSWNDGLAVTGIENAAGSVFYTPPGENGTTFTALNEGWRFSPATPINWTYTWKDSSGATVAIGDSVTLCPTVSTSRYSVTATDPAICLILNDNFTLVKKNGLGIDSIAFTNPTSCVTYDGTIVFHGMPPGDTISLTYIYNGTPIGPIIRYPDLDSNIVFSGLPSGAYDDFSFRHDSCTFGPYDFTLVAPPIVISHETFVNPSVCGECNGSITLYGLLPGQVAAITYSKGGVVQPVFTATVGTDSSVTLSGLCAGDYTGFVANIGSCSANGTPITIVNPPPIPATFTDVTKNHCNGDEVIVTNTSTPELGYTAYFTFGDGSVVDSSNAIPLPHIYPDGATDIGTYTITLTYQGYNNPACISTQTVTVSFNHPIDAAFTQNTNAVCLGDAIQFAGTTISTNGPSYSWNFGDGSPIVTGNPVSYTYPVGGAFTTTLMVKDSIGCDTTFADTSDVITIRVRTNTYDTAVCLLDSMPVFAYSVVNFPFVGWNYSWTPTNNIGLDSTYTMPGVTSSTSITHFLGVGTYTYDVLVTTTYPPLILDPNGCSDTSSETIMSYPPVTLTNVTASPQVISFGGSVYLNANGAVYYTWAPDNGTLNNPNVNDPIATPVDSTTIYTVYGMNSFGCRDSATVVIDLDNTMYPTVPGAFTPNGDGLNDVFQITLLKYQKLVELRIFNRWGVQVFYTSNPEVGWDGKYNGVPQDIGVYGYEVIVALPDGGNKVYKGNLTLLR